MSFFFKNSSRALPRRHLNAALVSSLVATLIAALTVGLSAPLVALAPLAALAVLGTLDPLGSLSDLPRGMRSFTVVRALATASARAFRSLFESLTLSFWDDFPFPVVDGVPLVVVLGVCLLKPFHFYWRTWGKGSTLKPILPHHTLSQRHLSDPQLSD